MISRSTAALAAPSPTLVPALPTLTPSSLLPAFSPPRSIFPLDRLGKDARMYYLARNGIFHGLRALGVGAGDAVLMPAYHHGVEVEAVRASGAEVRFYRVGRDLRGDLADAERLATTGDRRVRALYVTHFAGFAQPIAEWRALADRLGLLLVEDCALALFSRGADGAPLGRSGDLSVFCLYKTLPVPHGGIALARVPLPEVTSPPFGSTLHHVAGSLLARAEIAGGAFGRSLRAAARAASRRVVDKVVDTVQVGTQHMKPAELHLGASSLVSQILRRVDGQVVATRRRRNYNQLLAALGSERDVVPGALGPGEVPLFFPLVVRDRKAALERLWSQQIEAIDFWSFGDPACRLEAFPDAAWLRKHVIEIPIHQDLDDEAMEQVARSVKEVLAHV